MQTYSGGVRLRLLMVFLASTIDPPLLLLTSEYGILYQGAKVKGAWSLIQCGGMV